LSGAAFAREVALQTTSPAANELQVTNASALQQSRTAIGEISTARAEGGLTTLLRPGVTPPVRALTLPTQRLLLPKGAFIDCTLETAIDSTLPGMTTCVTATDTFGVDGKVVLLERGSKLVGETRGEVQNGAARVFVVWTEARTPTGVVVPLDSPGTDELGRSGLPGQVNRHFWDRFGAALLISVVDGVLQEAVQSSSRGSSAIIYNPAASHDVLADVLKGTLNIAPTVVKHQGDRIQILVARDLDFRPVYELRSVAAGR
jgi:type IV secretion system protein VirB10